MELLEDAGDAVSGKSLADSPCCRVMGNPQLLEVFVREAKERGVTIIEPGGDEVVDKNGSSVGDERGSEIRNIGQVEICRLSDVIDVRLERVCCRGLQPDS